MTVRSADSLPVLDLRALTDEQLRTAEAIFNEFRDKELKPAYLADADPNRALLDRRVVCDLLGFEEETYVGVRRLAAKWCAEPSVLGVKRGRVARSWWFRRRAKGGLNMSQFPSETIETALAEVEADEKVVISHAADMLKAYDEVTLPQD